MADVEEQLRRLADHRADQVAPWAPGALDGRPEARDRRRRRWPIVAVAACAASVGIGIVVAATSDDDGRPVERIETPAATGGPTTVTTATTATTTPTSAETTTTTVPTPVTLSAPTAHSGTAILGIDLDGDGRGDTLAATRGPETSTLTATLATGTTSSLEFPTCGDPLVGVARLDGQPLILYDVCGATVVNASMATVVDGRLRALSYPSTVPGQAQFPIEQVIWYAHSNGVPAKTADTACVRVDGRDALVITSSRLVNLDGSDILEQRTIYDVDRADWPTRYLRRWDRTVLVLDGATLSIVTQDSGTVRLDEASPEGVPLANRLSCPGITDPVEHD